MSLKTSLQQLMGGTSVVKEGTDTKKTMSSNKKNVYEGFMGSGIFSDEKEEPTKGVPKTTKVGEGEEEEEDDKGIMGGLFKKKAKKAKKTPAVAPAAAPVVAPAVAPALGVNAIGATPISTPGTTTQT